jgi:polyisoprenoid-binding protein YceI
MSRIPTAAAVLALAAVPAGAATYTIDKTHSEASFQVRHLVTQARGTFGDFSGTIQFDHQSPQNSVVQFTIVAATIDTAVPDRDQHLRSADFFDVARYPQISFRSTRIAPSGTDTFLVTGQLTMRGVTKEITLPVTYAGEVRDPWGNTKAGFSTETTLDRKDFGIVWNAALDQGGVLLGDQVKISINLEAKLEQPAPQPAP